MESFNDYRDQIVEQCKAGNKQNAQTILMEDGPKLSANFSTAIDSLSQIKEDTGRQMIKMNKSRAKTAVVATALLLILAGLVAARFEVVIAKIISAPLVEETKQLEVALTVLQRILSGMDTCIYVSDPQTDKLLFVNDQIKDSFPLRG